MVHKLVPTKGKVIFITQNTMLHILEGTGGIEIDFKSFHDWSDKLIFLEKGQCVKFLSDDFLVRKIDFEDATLHSSKDFRVLFKHLVSVGYINFDTCEACQQYLDTSILNSPDQILDVSAKQWYWQNPFKARKDEYHLIFDVKDVIDREFKRHLGTTQIMGLLQEYPFNPQKLCKEKVGLTIKGLQNQKLLAETKKEIAFSNKSIKEIAFDNGFKDPAYFNRFFRSKTGYTPLDFREKEAFVTHDQFVEDIYELVANMHQEQRKVSYYAQEMHLSVQALSKKVSEKLNISIGKLIRLETIKTAKKLLSEGRNVQEVSRLLHFEEPNHFSAFFKQYTGDSPSAYRLEKVQ